MASWSVMSVTGRSNVLNDATNLGANFYVTFRIKYTQSTFGAFIEPPIMAWDEVIMKCDYTKRQYNEFIGNMYTHKPASQPHRGRMGPALLPCVSACEGLALQQLEGRC